MAGRRRPGLAKRRRSRGFSQESLAAELHADRTTVARWERGQCDPQPYHRSKLCELLQVTPDELDELLRPEPTRGQDTKEEEPTRRRDALKLGAFAALSPSKVSTGHPGVDEADAACRAAGRSAPPTVQALLFERAAWTHAACGPAHQADVELALANAKIALDRNGDQPNPDWALWVDTIELQIMTGRCFSTLHRPTQAIAALEDALAQYGDIHARDKALYLTWLAEAHVEASNIDEAACILDRALSLSIGVASVRPYQRIQKILDQLRDRLQ